MASHTKNLSDVNIQSLGDCSQFKIGIVRSIWNNTITQALYDGCIQTLIQAGVDPSQIYTSEVPGSFELPLGAIYLDREYKLDAIVCIGCVIRGETSHNEYINQSVANALMQLSLSRNKPFVFGVLTPNDEQQALERAGGKHGNKGVEAAHTALKMAILRKSVSEPGKSIGFL